VASKSAQRHGSAAPTAKKHVMASVRLDVATHARVAAAAALAGLDKSAWMSRAITEALSGVVVIDRRNPKSAGEVDPSGEEDRTAA
jgi:hypothetical protein